MGPPPFGDGNFGQMWHMVGAAINAQGNGAFGLQALDIPPGRGQQGDGASCLNPPEMLYRPLLRSSTQLLSAAVASSCLHKGHCEGESVEAATRGAAPAIPRQDDIAWGGACPSVVYELQYRSQLLFMILNRSAGERPGARAFQPFERVAGTVRRRDGTLIPRELSWMSASSGTCSIPAKTP